MTVKSKNIVLLIFIMLIAIFFSVSAESTYAYEIDACLECHQDRNLTRVDEKTGKEVSQFVDKDAFLSSIHGSMGYNCIDCHTEATPEEHPADGYPEVNCAECHEDIQAAFDKSTHSMLDPRFAADTPKCYDCHTTHEVMLVDEPASSVHPDNIAQTCGACHPEEADPPYLSFISTRIKGHGKENLGCTNTTANCMDCHFDSVNHGKMQEKTALCMSCHAEEKTAAVFGTVHKAGFLKNPLLSIIIVLCWIFAAVLAFVFIKSAFFSKKQPTEKV